MVVDAGGGGVCGVCDSVERLVERQLSGEERSRGAGCSQNGELHGDDEG